MTGLLSTILQDELALRGVHSLTPSDYHEIIEQLIEHLRDLELNFAGRELAGKQPSSLMPD
ncbi:hypothetical protein IVA78_20320 [Bradyrhizobium sp. 137]|nr:hypothetical protein [Bradyrhizobium sp. 137]